MTSSRLILIFLGFIFLIIVILSSNRIAGALRDRFGKFLPISKTATTEVTPTPTIEAETPTPTIVAGTTSTPSGQIPATGPADLVYLLLGGSLLAGLALKGISKEAVKN